MALLRGRQSLLTSSEPTVLNAVGIDELRSLKSIRALERRRMLLTMYAMQERPEDVLRIINSKHLKRRKLNDIPSSMSPTLNPSDRSEALNERSSSRDIYSGKDIIAFRLLDYDSNGEERIYSLDGWD